MESTEGQLKRVELEAAMQGLLDSQLTKYPIFEFVKAYGSGG